LNDWGYPVATGEVPALLLSELVTNAIVFASQTNVELELSLTGGRLRGVVADTSLDPPRPQPAGSTAEGGRGLRLLDELAAEWGVEWLPIGKAVWFEVDLDAHDRLRSWIE
jgi:anti-sigma regulatory factor (Ser/Thr protein kinase)